MAGIPLLLLLCIDLFRLYKDKQKKVIQVVGTATIYGSLPLTKYKRCIDCETTISFKGSMIFLLLFGTKSRDKNKQVRYTNVIF